jgi:preprotein translocase subunit SecB
MTLEGGYPALMINPVDFRAVARARKRAARALSDPAAKSDS